MIPGSLVATSKKKQGSSLPAGRMIFAGYLGATTWSDDGVTWTNITPFGYGASTNTIYALAANGQIAVAGGTEKRFYYSYNGIDWTAGQTIAFNIYDIIVVDGVFYAMTTTGASQIYRSYDGISWTLLSQVLAAQNGRGLAYGNGLFVCIVSPNRLFTSTDASVWTERSLASTGTTNTDPINAVCYSTTSGLWIYVADANCWGKSTDGVTWQSRIKMSSSTSNLNYLSEVNGMLLTRQGSSTCYRTHTGDAPWTAFTGSENCVYKAPYYYFSINTSVQRTIDFVSYTTVATTASTIREASIIL